MRTAPTMTLKRLALTCTAALLLAGTAAWADSIGPTCGLGECLGNIYTLNHSQTSAQMGTDNYTITLTIDSSSFVDGTDSGFLMAVSPNISGWSSATLAKCARRYRRLVSGHGWGARLERMQRARHALLL
jgi:hypothetical protein